MKQLSLILAIVFAFCSSVIAQTSVTRGWSGSLEILIDGEESSADALKNRVFCLSNSDTLTIRYTPLSGEGEFVVFGCELWSQVSLGDPSLLAQLPAGNPGNPAEITMPLATLISPANLPSDGKAIRVVIRVRSIIEVDGNRFLGQYSVPPSATDFSFLLTRSCE